MRMKGCLRKIKRHFILAKRRLVKIKSVRHAPKRTLLMAFLTKIPLFPLILPVQAHILIVLLASKM
jgi:hypothetical protein